MPPQPLISVLLPAFNAADTLDACLRSVLRQTEGRWEWVIVDDGSTDGTVERARRFADRDPRFRVLSRRHAGLVPTLNTGLDAGRSGLSRTYRSPSGPHRRIA